MSEPIIHADVEQGSDLWLKLRLGRPTASEFDALLTPLFKAKTGDGPATYLSKKVAERWQNHCLPGFSSAAMEQGNILEEEAIPWYALEFDCSPKRVGFVEGADGRCGCSPDALLGDDSGLEIKCPAAHTHVSYLLAGKLPSEYAAQVHGSLYVTGRKTWCFMSYCRKFPKLILTIERDEEIMEKIGGALATFYAQFDAAMDRMKAIKASQL